MIEPTLQPGETARSFDLGTMNYRRAWNVANLDSGVLRLDLAQGVMGSAVVTLQQTHDWLTWQGLGSAVTINASAASAAGYTTRTLDFTSVAGLAAVTTTDKSGVLATLTLYGKNAQTIT